MEATARERTTVIGQVSCCFVFKYPSGTQKSVESGADGFHSRRMMSMHILGEYCASTRSILGSKFSINFDTTRSPGANWKGVTLMRREVHSTSSETLSPLLQRYNVDLFQRLFVVHS